MTTTNDPALAVPGGDVLGALADRAFRARDEAEHAEQETARELLDRRRHYRIWGYGP